MASDIFAGAGVKLSWRPGFKGCPRQGILITMMNQTPPAMHPRALAYATPYEGTHIWIFYDRVAQSGRSLLPFLLTNVIVHEVAHVLQGTVRHSEQGIMKAHWSQDDFNSMLRRELTFNTDDIDLINEVLRNVPPAWLRFTRSVRFGPTRSRGYVLLIHWTKR
jgi:hypothetical protein